MATTLTYLDAYCERGGDPALWAEPLNAATNLFFIGAAVMAALALRRTARGEGAKRYDLWALCATLFAIGIGSGLWHLHPNGATVLMDVLPITLFINLYLIASMRRLLQMRWCVIFFWWALYTGMSIVAQSTLPPDTLNGTIMYIPTYFTLAILSLAVYRKNKAAGRVFFYMLGLWTFSLLFRTIDPHICTSLPIGTHFLWHTLNAIMLYRLLLVLIQHSTIRHSRESGNPS